MDAPKPILTPAEMTDYAIEAATAKVTSRSAKSFLLALTAGCFIGIGMIFYLVSQQGADKMPLGMAKVVGGVVFSVGLALVVLTGAELFTGSTLSLAAWMDRRISALQLVRNWVVVYLGNIGGALTLVLLMWFAGTWQSSKGSLGLVALKTADAKCAHTFVQSLFLGILCNMLVCLAVWLTYAGRTAADKIVALTLPIAMFVASGFEHSVANMYILPFAKLIKDHAPASFWTAAASSPSEFAHLTWHNILVMNLLPVTIGNIIGGGVMIGMFYTLVHKRLGSPASK